MDTAEGPPEPKQGRALLQKQKSSSLLPRAERPGSAIGIVMAGDVIYLRAHTGKYIDVVNGTVTCREDGHGERAMLRIEKEGDGGIHSGDTIRLRTPEMKYVGVYKEAVTADWDTYESSGMVTDSKELSLVGDDGTWNPDDGMGGWGPGGPAGGGQPGSGKLPPLPGGIQSAFVIERKQPGTDYIRVGDKIHIRTYTTKHIDVQGTAVQAALSDDYASETEFTVESDPKPPPPRRPYPNGPPGPDAIKAGDTVYLRAYTGKHLEVYRGIGPSVMCVFDRHSKVQAFTIEKTAGGFIHQGDTVYLKSWQHFHLLVSGTIVREIREGSWRPDQAFIIERNVSGTGAIQVNESIYLRSHTGKYLDVYNHWCPFIAPRVHVKLDDYGERAAFTIERDAPSSEAPGAPSSPGAPAPVPNAPSSPAVPAPAPNAPSSPAVPAPAPQPAAKTFSVQRSGNCAKPIKTEEDCKAAAAKLGVKYPKGFLSKWRKKWAPGCTKWGRKLRFNKMEKSTATCPDRKWRFCLCED